MNRHLLITSLLALGAAAAGCSDYTDPAAPVFDAVQSNHLTPPMPGDGAGAVYLMSNAAGPNEVVAFARHPDGSLTPQTPVATGGSGTGQGLGNQGAVTATRDGRWLLVVNPGSDDISLMRVTPQGVELADRAPSGGSRPISVAVHGNLVYVLNAGTPNNVSGLAIGEGGDLTPIPGSTRPLSGDAVGPAQIGFSPDGRTVVVTEKATNLITTFSVTSAGQLSQPTSSSSAAPTPFGFAFDQRGNLIVSEAAGGAADASSVSSYRVERDGSLRLVEGPVATTETAACWIAIPESGRFAYTTNAGSGSISGLSITAGGDLELLDLDGVTGDAGAGSTPLDAAFSRGGRYLYVLTAGNSTVTVFETDANGGLRVVGSADVPATANGVAAL